MKTKKRVNKKHNRFFACRGCECWHSEGFDGDCRDNSTRFTAGQLDVLFPDKNGDGWPDWEEVDEKM